MSSSFYAISLIKRSNMLKEQFAISLLNLSKEALCDFLNESRLIDKSHNITKNKMIELIINCDMIDNNRINTITNETERLRINNAQS